MNIKNINSNKSVDDLNLAKALLITMIINENSPRNMRLTILSYAIDLFENTKISFSINEIENFINSVSDLEDYLDLESKKTVNISHH